MNTRQVAKGDRAFFAISTAAAMFTMFLVLAVLVFLSIKSWATFSQQGLAFVTGSTWDNTTELGTFQLWPMLVGTIVVSILGLIIVFLIFFLPGGILKIDYRKLLAKIRGVKGA